MEATLKRLLDAEHIAQGRIEETERERDRILEQAWQEAHDAEARFEQRMTERRRSELERADEQAEQEIAELKRAYDHRLEKLEEAARRHHRLAVRQTLDWLLDPENP